MPPTTVIAVCPVYSKSSVNRGSGRASQAAAPGLFVPGAAVVP